MSPDRCSSAATSSTQPPTPSMRTMSDSALRSLRKRRLVSPYPSSLTWSSDNESSSLNDDFVSRHVLRSKVAVYNTHKHRLVA